MAAPMGKRLSAVLQNFCSHCQLLSSHHAVIGAAAVRFNSNRATVAKTNRKKYTRFYPTMIVNQDGSTYWIKYNEPKYILQLPVDMNSLSYDDRKKRLKRYTPKKKDNIVEDDLSDDEFDSNKYKHLWKKGR